MLKISWQKDIVLITGAGHGLGRAVSLALGSLGAKIVVTDRNFKTAQETCDLIEKKGGSAVAIEMDVTDLNSIISVKDKINQYWGPISILINNAGIVIGGDFEKVSLEKHLRTVDINLKGVIQVTHCFLPDLLNHSRSALVNISSASALLALPFASTYAASKWGVLGFTESLREELKLQKKFQLKVTAVCPSYISTGMFEGIRLPLLMRWVTPDRLAKRIVQAISKKEENVLTPWNVLPVPIAKGLLPRRWFLTLCRWLGVSQSMASWQGHTH